MVDWHSLSFHSSVAAPTPEKAAPVFVFLNNIFDNRWLGGSSLVQLLESDVLGVLPEELTAHVDVVFPDKTVSVGAGTALPGSGSVFPWARVPDVFETHLDLAENSSKNLLRAETKTEKPH